VRLRNLGVVVEGRYFFRGISQLARFRVDLGLKLNLNKTLNGSRGNGTLTARLRPDITDPLVREKVKVSACVFCVKLYHMLIFMPYLAC
jgi:hypothetical protein